MNSMIRKILVCLLTTMLLATVSATEAQKQPRVPKIGWLGARSFSGPDSRQGSGAELFVVKFSKLGYVDGKDITIGYRFAGDKYDRLPALVDELVRLKVDLIMAAATVEALVAKNATGTIPVIFFIVPDPVASGLS